MAAEGIIDDLPAFTSHPDEKSRNYPAILNENDIVYAIFNCGFLNEKNPKKFGLDTTSETENYVYSTIKIKLDEKLINYLRKINTEKIEYYRDQYKRRQTIGGVVKFIQQFDERKKSESS